MPPAAARFRHACAWRRVVRRCFRAYRNSKNARGPSLPSFRRQASCILCLSKSDIQPVQRFVGHGRAPALPLSARITALGQPAASPPAGADWLMKNIYPRHAPGRLPGNTHLGQRLRRHLPVAAHNSRGGAKYTRSRRPVTLVWSQAFASQHAAMHWEWEIKQWPRAKKIDLIQTQQRLPEEE